MREPNPEILNHESSHITTSLHVDFCQNRARPFLGCPSGTHRSRSYNHMAYNSQGCCLESIHSDPLCRKAVHSINAGDAAGFVPAHGHRGRYGHTTHYVIVNEHLPCKKLLRSATRIPQHNFIEDSTEILNPCPHNGKCYIPRAAYYQPRPHRPKPSQQHPSEEALEAEKGKGRRRVSLVKTHRPHSLSDLHQPPHFYIGGHLDKNLSSPNDSHIPQRRYLLGEENDDDDERKFAWVDFEPQTQFQKGLKGEPLLVQRRHPIQSNSPGRRCQSPRRKRHLDSCVKPKIVPKPEVPLTESDSASVASSSDQQNSSTDQYIQVIPNKKHYVKSNVQQGKKKRSNTSYDLKVVETNDMVFSNV